MRKFGVTEPIVEITQIKGIPRRTPYCPRMTLLPTSRPTPITYRRSGANTNPRRGITFVRRYAGDWCWSRSWVSIPTSLVSSVLPMATGLASAEENNFQGKFWPVIPFLPTK